MHFFPESRAVLGMNLVRFDFTEVAEQTLGQVYSQNPLRLDECEPMEMCKFKSTSYTHSHVREECQNRKMPQIHLMELLGKAGLILKAWVKQKAIFRFLPEKEKLSSALRSHSSFNLHL